jgi:hypothetical protein
MTLGIPKKAKQDCQHCINDSDSLPPTPIANFVTEIEGIVQARTAI